MKAHLVLGCHGHRRYGFSTCRGTKNILLELDKLGSNTNEILDYLDGHCKVFDKVLTDVNVVNSTLQYLMKQNLIPGHISQVIYEYMAMHKTCGLYIFVEPVE